MSRTHELFDKEGRVWHLITNSDLSGEVRIHGPSGAFGIPNSVLLQYVAEHIRNEKIAALEQAEAHELLGIQKVK